MRGRIVSRAVRLTFEMISSSTGPRAEARELIARRAGTGRISSNAFCASSVVYARMISAALEFDKTTRAPRLHAAITACCRRHWSNDEKPPAV